MTVWEQTDERQVGNKMKRKWICLLLVLMLGASLLAGCSANQAAREDADTITVYPSIVR